ncbi:ATP-binding protein [Psychromonas sp. KJ10-10]|uniref:sensor histidine kinase n=1 Tax=Psychromonas sp. KJ10-10 TaxID=3391823 RepID=UPI0039B6A96A
MQISLIMLLGVLLILSVCIQLYSDDRQRALDFVSSDSTFERVSSLIAILGDTPSNLHNDIISASQGRGFYLSLGAKPVIESAVESPLTLKLKGFIPDAQFKDIRVVASSLKHNYKERDIRRQQEKQDRLQEETDNSKKQEKYDRIKRTRYNVKLTGSIQLADHSWLNFSSAIDEQADNLPLQTVLLIIISTILILSTMAWTVKRALKPIEILAIVAKKVGNERYFNNIPEVGPSEVLPAISAFNQMQTNLSDFIDDRDKMLATISHDLRTPITSLRLRLEFIEASEDKSRMLETVNQMEKMLKATLDFAKDDAQKENKQDLELVSLMSTICDEYRDRGIDIQLKSAEKLIFRLWPTAFRRVIENLINNSIAYGKDEQGEVHITVAMRKHVGNLILSISDTGSGIEESLFEEVIKPFVRLDKARDTQDSSVGLGLAISHSIIQAHAGRISFSNLKTGGLKVEITLPTT